MTNAICVLEAFKNASKRSLFSLGKDGKKDMDGNMPRPKIRGCSISDPYVFIVRKDDSIDIFIG
jgi:cleavage and polyadenylation specificity factor subunit 1